jgi:hypothetical protein
MRQRLIVCGIDPFLVPPGDLDRPVEIVMELYAKNNFDAHQRIRDALPEFDLGVDEFVFPAVLYPEPQDRFQDRPPLTVQRSNFWGVPIPA